MLRTSEPTIKDATISSRDRARFLQPIFTEQPDSQSCKGRHQDEANTVSGQKQRVLVGIEHTFLLQSLDDFGRQGHKPSGRVVVGQSDHQAFGPDDVEFLPADDGLNDNTDDHQGQEGADAAVGQSERWPLVWRQFRF